MPEGLPQPLSKTIFKDIVAGMVVFLVALPLCLGVANASRASGIADGVNATILSGIIAGIVGGIVVGLLSNSHTSVSGPAAGLTAVVALQIAKVGTFQGFLVAVMLAGMIQLILGYFRTGSLAEFFPSSVIKGLLTAIGVILILKQLPHLVGHDTDPEGDMAFDQPDNKNTFTELLSVADDFNIGALIIGLSSLFILIFWDRFKTLKTFVVPSALVVVLWGILLNVIFRDMGGKMVLGSEHEVKLPEPQNAQDFFAQITTPDFSVLTSSAVYLAAFVLAIVASLETLLNIEAVEKLDPKQRRANNNRELGAQGVGNIISGALGGLPVTSVIVRSSANINAGSQTKLSTVVHGVFLLLCVALIPHYLNMIPLACLAAILLQVGYKLASPKIVRQMWKQGNSRFLPFIATVLAIVFTDLLIGIIIGLVVAVLFIIHSNLRRPVRVITEKHMSGEVVRIELANQVSFLNRASLVHVLEGIPRGGHVLLDASSTSYIDPDILDLINDFKEVTGPARKVEVSLFGFSETYNMQDRLMYVDYSTREVQDKLTPRDVFNIMKDGHERFITGEQLNRDLGH